MFLDRLVRHRRGTLSSSYEHIRVPQASYGPGRPRISSDHIEPHTGAVRQGALAQLGERLICIQEVSGSIPLGSTKTFAPRRSWVEYAKHLDNHGPAGPSRHLLQAKEPARVHTALLAHRFAIRCQGSRFCASRKNRLGR